MDWSIWNWTANLTRSKNHRTEYRLVFVLFYKIFGLFLLSSPTSSLFIYFIDVIEVDNLIQLCKIQGRKGRFLPEHPWYKQEMKTSLTVLETGKLFWGFFLIPHVGIWSINGKTVTSYIFLRGCWKQCSPLLILVGYSVYA